MDAWDVGKAAGLPNTCTKAAAAHFCVLSVPCPTCTCHDVLHHRHEVGGLAEGGRVVVLILEGSTQVSVPTGQCVSGVLGQLPNVGTKG